MFILWLYTHLWYVASIQYTGVIQSCLLKVWSDSGSQWLIVFLFLSNTFRVKRSPKKSPLSDTSQVCTSFSIFVHRSHLSLSILSFWFSPSSLWLFHFVLQEPTPADEPSSLHPQDDHATDEEKLASSTSHKWANLQDMDANLNSDQQDFPHPSDLTSFVNENSLPLQNPGEAKCSCLTPSLHLQPPVRKQMLAEIKAYHRQTMLKGNSKHMFGWTIVYTNQQLFSLLIFAVALK